MPNYLDAFHAYSFSYEVLEVWRSGKGFVSDPDACSGGGTGMGIIHRAMDVEAIADKHDPGIEVHIGVPTDRRGSWFARYFIAQEHGFARRNHEKIQLFNAICAFCRELQEREITYSGECRRCPAKYILDLKKRAVL